MTSFDRLQKAVQSLSELHGYGVYPTDVQHDAWCDALKDGGCTLDCTCVANIFVHKFGTCLNWVIDEHGNPQVPGNN